MDSKDKFICGQDSIEFTTLYKEAYKNIDRGITLASEDKKIEAASLFEKGLHLIEKALNTKVESLNATVEKIQLFTEMQNKMRITKKEISEQLSVWQVGSNISSQMQNHDDPPSYDEYLSSLSSEAVSYPILLEKNVSMKLTIPEENSPLVTPNLSPQMGELIFHIETGVQIFFIYADGSVTSPSTPSFLSIFTFSGPICENSETGQTGARGFLQVGEWNYPLAQTPVLHSFYGAYMFPDAANPVPGTSVGVLIPDTLTKESIGLFEQLLRELTSFQTQVVPKGVDPVRESALFHETAQKNVTEKTTGQYIAEGAEEVAKGVVWGADKLSKYITYGSEKLKESIAPQSNVAVDPKWKKTASVAKNVSGKAVKISGFLLNQVGKATLALGRYAAPTIKRQGTKVLSSLTGSNENKTEEQVGTVMDVASGTVQGLSTIYFGLENAATNLAASLTDNTVKVVSHRYGDEYGQLTGDTLYAVGQTAMTGYNLTALGPKGLAKRAAKDAGKEVIHSYNKKDGQSALKKNEDYYVEGVAIGTDVARASTFTNKEKNEKN